VVMVRALTAIPSQVLKGTGHHRYLAMTTSCCAVATVLLSIPAVKLVGMVGVAWAMLLPTGVTAAVFVFPRACRVVGLPLARGYREIVWPALWPAAAVIALLALTRHAIPVHLVAVFAHVALGVLLYAATFLFALPRDERAWFSNAIRQVTGIRLSAPGYGLRARKSEV
jgi:O-antigen/teichoic acid export membrane protein